jgi:hypothetical protein
MTLFFKARISTILMSLMEKGSFWSWGLNPPTKDQSTQQREIRSQSSDTTQNPSFEGSANPIVFGI